MQLHVADAVPGRGRDALKRADLVEHEAADLVGRVAEDRAAAKAPQIQKARVRADRDALRPGGRDRLVHDERVAAMEAAGDVGAGDEVEHRPVVADPVGAEAFAHVAVEIDLHRASQSCRGAAIAQQPKLASFGNFAPLPAAGKLGSFGNFGRYRARADCFVAFGSAQ